MSSAVERAFREESGRVLATLIRHLGGDFQLAEDALQEAFAVALATWPRDGEPANPGAWITTAARRKAIDRLRRERAFHDRLPTLPTLMELDRHEEAAEPDDESARRRPPAPRLHLLSPRAGDGRARRADPAHARRAHHAEIARAFLVPSRRWPSASCAPSARSLRPGSYRCPATPRSRSPRRRARRRPSSSTRATPPAPRSLVRAELCAEASASGACSPSSCPTTPRPPGCWRSCSSTMRAATPGPATAATWRCPTRTARAGTVALAEGGPARSRLRLRRTGPYQLQAAIASLHCETEVDWPQIAALYRLLACGALARDRGQPRGGAGHGRQPDAGLRCSSASTSTATSLPRRARRAAAPQRRRRGRRRRLRPRYRAQRECGGARRVGAPPRHAYR